MNQQTWTAVDRYICDMLVGTDDALERALQSSRDAGLPAINVAPNQGKLLHLLARIQGARRILEIGTLGGYSAIWLARALPAGGKLVTLELDPKHAAVAAANIDRAGLSPVVDLRVGPARDTLSKLAVEGGDPFDLTFIDADKVSTVDYFNSALRLSRPGSLIIVDNVIRSGEVADPRSADVSVQAIRHFNELLAREHRVSATAIQTVGSKGYDGFTIVRVNTD